MVIVTVGGPRGLRPGASDALRFATSAPSLSPHGLRYGKGRLIRNTKRQRCQDSFTTVGQQILYSAFKTSAHHQRQLQWVRCGDSPTSQSVARLRRSSTPHALLPQALEVRMSKPMFWLAWPVINHADRGRGHISGRLATKARRKMRLTQPMFAALKARPRRCVTTLGVGRSAQPGSRGLVRFETWPRRIAAAQRGCGPSGEVPALRVGASRRSSQAQWS